METTTYRLNEDLRIVEVGGDWEGFATRNDGCGLDPASVIGTRLFSWISDDRTKMWVDAVFQRLYISNSVQRRYRCDSENAVRELEMHARRHDDGGIVVSNSVVRIQRSENVVLISTTRHLGSKPALRCSVCNSIRKDGEWVDPFQQGRDQSYRVVHTVCGECWRSVRAQDY